MKNTKKLLSMILVLSMIIGILTMLGSISAGAASAAYNGTPTTPTVISESTYASLGLAADKWQQYNGYYAIRNASELYGFANIANTQNASANAVLLDDIVINSGTVTESGSSSGTTYRWVGIGDPGNSSFYYKGTFDGNGHSVSGVYMKADENVSWSYVGFFRVISGATIRNLTIKNSCFHAESDIGAIAGHAIGSTSYINGCRIEGDVSVIKGTEGQTPYVGGILGGSPLGGGGTRWPVYCRINDSAFLGNVIVKSVDFTGANTNREYIGAISGTCYKEGNAHDHVESNNCYFISGSVKDKNGNTKYKNGTTTLEFNTAMGGGYDSKNIYWGTSGGSKQISSASEAHSPVIAEHKGIKDGDSGYRYCVVCNKKITTITLTAPTSYVIPGTSMQITAKADYSEVTSFTIAGGTNYTVNGMIVKTSADALVGSEITVKVTSAETANVHAAEATIKFNVAVVDSTAEIEKLKDELDAAIADLSASLMAENADLSEEIEELRGAINAAQNAIDTLETDSATKTELRNAVATAQNALEAAINKVAADLEAARNDLQNKIDANDERITDEVATLNETIKATKEALEAADAKNREELEAALKKAEETLEAAINKVAEDLEATRKDLQDKIDANTSLIESEVDRLDELVATTREILEEADAKNRRELEAALAQAEKTLQKSIESVSNRLTNAQKVLLNVINAGDIQLDNKITALNAALSEAIALLDTKTVESDAALKAELLATIEAADKALDEAIKAVQKNLDDAKAELSEAIASGDASLTEKITALDAALKSAEAALKAADESDKAALETAIAKTDADLRKLIADGDKQSAEALAAAMTVLRAEMDQAKKDAQVVPTVLVIIALVGDVVLAACLIISKKRRV